MRGPRLLIQDAVYVLDVNASWSKAFRGFKPISVLFGKENPVWHREDLQVRDQTILRMLTTACNILDVCCGMQLNETSEDMRRG